MATTTSDSCGNRVRGESSAFAQRGDRSDAQRFPGAFALLAALLLASGAAGCTGSQGPPTTDEIAARHLGRIGLWYGMFVGKNGGKPPKTIDDLRKYGQERITPEELAALGVADVGELFVSVRDGKPYKMVKYDKAPAPSGDPTVVFYEENGLDGTRRVALLGGGSLAVDEARLKELAPSIKLR